MPRITSSCAGYRAESCTPAVHPTAHRLSDFMAPKTGSNPNQYLQKIGNTYYARVKVPRTLQAIVKQTHLRRSLKTGSRVEANLRKHAVVSEIKAELAALRRAPPTEDTPYTFAEARAIRNQLEQLRAAGDDDQVEAIEMAVSDHAERIERLHGAERASRWFRTATATGENLREQQDRWLSASDYKESTKAGHRKALRDLLTFMRNEDAQPRDVNLQVAIAYIDDDLTQRNLAHATIRDRLVSLGGFWEWMGTRGAVPRGTNPWANHRISKKQNVGTRPPKRGYTDDEVLRLLEGNAAVRKWPTYTYLPDLAVLGLFTGARIDELCSLTATNIEGVSSGYLLRIADAKTKAGIRYVAVRHNAALAVIKRRTKGLSGSAPLFPELSPGGLDEKMSSSAVKAYGRYRRSCGVPDGTDFHSFRRTVVTTLERANVSQVSIARFVGHKVGTLAADSYSDGGDRKLALEVAGKVRYASAVEKAALEAVSR